MDTTLVDKARRIAIPGYEDLYEIDEGGVVYNLAKDRPIYVDTSNKHGYHRVNLFGPEGRKRMFVHRLVNQSFKPEEWDPAKVVDHISGDKTNNHYLNTRNVSQSENTLAAIALGLRIYKRKEDAITAIPGERTLEG